MSTRAVGDLGGLALRFGPALAAVILCAVARRQRAVVPLSEAASSIAVSEPEVLTRVSSRSERSRSSSLSSRDALLTVPTTIALASSSASSSSSPRSRRRASSVISAALSTCLRLRLAHEGRGPSCSAAASGFLCALRAASWTVETESSLVRRSKAARSCGRSSTSRARAPLGDEDSLGFELGFLQEFARLSARVVDDPLCFFARTPTFFVLPFGSDAVLGRFALGVFSRCGQVLPVFAGPFSASMRAGRLAGRWRQLALVG